MVKMKKVLILFVVLVMPMFVFGENYASLWKKVAEAEKKDLPKTEYELLQQIVKKAGEGKDYGHLLKAMLKRAQVMADIAPDSLKPEVVRIRQYSEQTTDEVQRIVYQTVLYSIGNRNPSLKVSEKPRLTEALCRQLAQVKDVEYVPFVIEGSDSELFGHDLLSIVGYELDELGVLYDYYAKTGNRRAACVVAAREFRNSSVEKIDELLSLYQDLPEAGELAIARYGRMDNSDVKERMDFIHEALGKWGGWQRMNYLRNEEKELTNPEVYVTFDRVVAMPGQATTLVLKKMRNLQSLTMKVYQVKANGDITLRPSNRKDYEKIKPLLGKVVNEQTRQYRTKAAYEYFEDALTVPELPVGVYMVEFSSPSGIKPVRCLYFVTDVFVIAEPQPTDTERYVVVSARTGQPIPGARLRIKTYQTYSVFKTSEGVTDEKGEYIFKGGDRTGRRREVYAYTDTDKACPGRSNSMSYSYYQDIEKETVTRTHIYTDRRIYRPGQTVHVSALTYQVKKGIEQSVCERRQQTFRLYDANRKQIAEQKVETDAYGVATVDFTLPSSGLTGSFRIQVDDHYQYILVEEYKRPTFYVEFPEVKEAYAAGDTLPVKGAARSYAGVPVQDAKVSYRVVRRTAFWWRTRSRHWDMDVTWHGHGDEEIAKGEAKTDDNGRFIIDLPLILPESADPMFYNFVVTADVTDAAGETRSGQFSLPLGNRKTTLTVDVPDKILADEKPEATIHLMNAAGQDLDAEVDYQIDGGQWHKVRTNSKFPILTSPLSSGKHTIKAICESDTVERSFVLFSLDDQVPATETDDWFYQSATQFPCDGSPVTIQVGSSAADVHIVYSIFSGKKLIESGSVDRSNRLFNLNVTYKADYGNGLLLTFAWVKNQKCYAHTAEICRPMPDKELKLQWMTFRDRTKPGQQEEWMLSVKDAAGKPVDAQLMATLYDNSLDQIASHRWTLNPYLAIALPLTAWHYPTYSKVSDYGCMDWKYLKVKDLALSVFDESVIPSLYHRRVRSLASAVGGNIRGSYAVAESAKMAEPMMAMKMDKMAQSVNTAGMDDSVEEDAEVAESGQVEMRENLNETAFFYPQLTTDKDGHVALKFTLPESLTTWRFMGLAHTKDMYYGSIEGTTVAQKDVMIQPNVPRFLREGDKAVIAARIFNIGEKELKGKATLTLLDPETDKVVMEQSQSVTLKAGGTSAVSFKVQGTMFSGQYSLLVCQMSVSGEDFSDGEQHYLPVLSASEYVTVTVPITQHGPGTETVDVAGLIPADAGQTKLTVEYTDNPAWLMIQALPSLGGTFDDNAVSLAAAYYANALGKYIIDRQPQAKKAFELWKQEAAETSLTSALEKNQELKDILLNETPWVLDADREAAQKQCLADFFDDNLMKNRLSMVADKLSKLQNADGSWSWWSGMRGSFHMTVAVSEMLVRLNDMAGSLSDVKGMLSKAFDFMGNEVVKEVEEMKKWEKEGHKAFIPGVRTLQWLYLATLDGRALPSDVQKANGYLLNLLKKDIKNQTLYEKALMAVVLSKSEPKRAQEYLQSLKEYSVYREEMGRYYDTPRAGYSWFDYKIPTQTVAIEAMQRLAPADRQTVGEMQRWLLQEKRTQVWDTPINSVNAVYAFLMGGQSPLTVGDNRSRLEIDHQPLDVPKATAALGYVKTNMPATTKTLTVGKTSEGTSWGAVYAQFIQPTKHIKDAGNGLTVKREILSADNSPLSALHSPLAVGDRIKVRITIEADRDYDFVQVIDKRAACLEPVQQLSGYRRGVYCSPKDNTTYYYFDTMPKGTRVIETEYSIDRPGTYETGTCTVQCAYAPEFHGITKSQTLNVK